MLDANGLEPSSKGARVRFSGAKRTVIDGPFAETKELVAGYWILQVKSKAEAIEWIKRCPNPHEGESEIEIRQIFELEDFGDSEAVEHHCGVGESDREEVTLEPQGARDRAALRRQGRLAPVHGCAVGHAVGVCGDKDNGYIAYLSEFGLIAHCFRKGFSSPSTE
jgi:hypothetical protein